DLRSLRLAVREVDDALSVGGPARVRSLDEEAMLRAVGVQDPDLGVPAVLDRVDVLPRVQQPPAVGRDLDVVDALPIEVVLGRQAGRAARFLRAERGRRGDGDRQRTREALHRTPAVDVDCAVCCSPWTDSRRFGMRSSACWNCAAASFARPVAFRNWPYSSNDGLIGSGGPDGASIVASIAVASLSSRSASAVFLFMCAMPDATSFAMTANGLAR